MNIKKKAFENVPRYLFFLLATAVLILPFYWMLSTSFKTDNEIFTYPIRWLPSAFYFGNFKRALEIMPIPRYMLNTVIIAVLKIAGEVIVSALVAYGFARHDFKFKQVIFGILLATMMLPYEVTMIPTFILWSELGFANSYVPLILPAYFGSASFIFFLRMYFSTFPKDMEEAMFIDGANRLQVFSRLYIPLSKAALVTIGIWSFMGTWNDLLGQLIYISDEAKYTVQLGLASFSNMTGETLWGPLMAASVLVLLPIFVIFFFLQRYFVDGIRIGSIKG